MSLVKLTDTSRIAKAALIAGLLATAVACGGSGNSTSDGSHPDAAPASRNQVIAVETDNHIALSRTTFTPGTYTFVAENKASDLPHALTVLGSDVNKATPTLAPGKTASITVTLRSGRYDIYCPVTDHKLLGMNLEVTVD
jgi:hypothetical protein